MTATTTLGTPASPKWDDAWVARVDWVEQSLGRRICGAHTPAWTPCKLTSTHANGRCRFHGGAAGIGAPNGNRNAWVHGLYSRRLQQCGDHCPLWRHCPMAGDDVLDTHPTERPHCVYEQEEYDLVLASLRDHKSEAPCDGEAPFGGIGFQPMREEQPSTRDRSPNPHGLEGHATKPATPNPSSLRKQGSLDTPQARQQAQETLPPHAGTKSSCDSSATCSSGDPCFRRDDEGGGTGKSGGATPLCDSAPPREAGATYEPAPPRKWTLIENNVALFQVMLSRAQAALRVNRITDESYARSRGYESRSTRVGALLQAQLHIARELRQWLKLLQGPKPGGDAARNTNDPDTPKPKSLHDTFREILDETAGVFEEVMGVPYGSHLCSAPRAKAWHKRMHDEAHERGKNPGEVYGYPEDDPPVIHDPPPA